MVQQKSVAGGPPTSHAYSSASHKVFFAFRSTAPYFRSGPTAESRRSTARRSNSGTSPGVPDCIGREPDRHSSRCTLAGRKPVQSNSCYRSSRQEQPPEPEPRRSPGMVRHSTQRCRPAGQPHIPGRTQPSRVRSPSSRHRSDRPNTRHRRRRAAQGPAGRPREAFPTSVLRRHRAGLDRSHDEPQPAHRSVRDRTHGPGRHGNHTPAAPRRWPA